MRPVILPLLLLLAPAALAAPAAADGRVWVDPGAPFTERDLTDAVSLRGVAVDAVVTVGRLGSDRLIVTVDGRSQVVVLADRDREATSRVVALVVAGLAERDRPGSDEEPAPPSVTEAPVAAPSPARTALRAALSFLRDDNGYTVPLVHGGAAMAVAPGVRLVGSVGVGRFDGYLETSSTLVPLRLGVEGRAGALGVEVGAQSVQFHERTCGGWGSTTSVTGAARVYLPAGTRTRLVAELGGYMVGASDPAPCNSAFNYSGYGGWLGLGLELPR